MGLNTLQSMEKAPALRYPQARERWNNSLKAQILSTQVTRPGIDSVRENNQIQTGHVGLSPMANINLSWVITPSFKNPSRVETKLILQYKVYLYST